MNFKSRFVISMAALGCLNAAFAAKILKRDGQVVEGTIQGRVAVKSTYASVTAQGKQYGVYFYSLIDGGSVVEVAAKDMSVTSGQFTLLTTSWELGGSGSPPPDLDALAKAAAPLPRGFPIQFGFFDNGAGWAQLALSSSSAGTVNGIFAYPTNSITSTNAPSLLAKPTIGKILGEYTSAAAGLVPALQVVTPGGTVRIPVEEIVAYQVEITTVANAASSQPGPVAPGEFVSIYGSALGPVKGVASTSLEKGLAGVKVTFNGVEAFLTFVSGTQVNAIVPYGVTGKADAVVEYGGLKSAVFPLALTDSSPGIFTRQFGAGQAWVVNQDNSFNTAANAAARGEYVAFWATGQGLVDPAGQDGEIVTAARTIRLPVKVSIGGGAPFTPEFAGLIYTGVIQVNLKIPDNSPTGNAELLLTIGGATSRRGVTIAVR